MTRNAIVQPTYAHAGAEFLGQHPCRLPTHELLYGGYAEGENEEQV